MMNESTAGGYENAPATKMLATHCACCSRPLVDAVSVETGVGPECRKKHGYVKACEDVDVLTVAAALASTLPREVYDTVFDAQDARTAANRLVHRIACEQSGPHVVACVNALRALGFFKLTNRITERLASIEIRETDGTLTVKAPYVEDATPAWRAVPGRRWDKVSKCNAAPVASRRAVWSVLQRYYAGAVAVGPKGLFTI